MAIGKCRLILPVVAGQLAKVGHDSQRRIHRDQRLQCVDVDSVAHRLVHIPDGLYEQTVIKS